jgi:catechol 2,3-dioxygenase-like lactoylglutathione lyase family enzyme
VGGDSTVVCRRRRLAGVATSDPELRLVVTVTDFERALAIYRDALGLAQVEDYSTPTSRVVVLNAGRATIELADAAHAQYVDEVEVGRRTAGTIRLAFEVADTRAATHAVLAAGATLVAEAVVTPWDTSNSRLESGEGFQLTLFGPPTA